MSPSLKLESQIDLHVTMNNNIKESPNDNEQNNNLPVRFVMWLSTYFNENYKY
jgi:hypothetical protein